MYSITAYYLFKKMDSKYNLFYVHFIGSLLYVLLHYFLFIKNYENTIIKYIKTYIYYVVVLDFAIACYLYKKSMDKIEVKPENTVINNYNENIDISHSKTESSTSKTSTCSSDTTNEPLSKSDSLPTLK